MSLLFGENDQYKLNLFVQESLNIDTNDPGVDGISYDIQENDSSNLSIYRVEDNVATEIIEFGSSNTTINNNLVVSGSISIGAMNTDLDMNNFDINNASVINGTTGNITTLNSTTINNTGDIDTTGDFTISNTSVLNSTTLGSGVVNSSLTSVGTLNNLTVSGDATFDTNTFVVDSTNNRIGVGIASPTTTIEVQDSTGDTELRMISGTGNDKSRIMLGESSVFGHYFQYDSLENRTDIGAVVSSADYQLLTFTRTTAPRVGIGITNPSYKLDVSGDINSTGDYRISGTSVLNSTTLGSGIVNSSLTSVGTLGSLTVSGDAIIGTDTFQTYDSINTVGIGNLQVQVDATITGDLTVDTSTLKVDSTNNRVGINTASPSEDVHIIGDTRLEGLLALYTESDSNLGGSIKTTGDSGGANGLAYYASRGGGYHSFRANQASVEQECLRIDNDGTVNITDNKLGVVYETAGTATDVEGIRIGTNIGSTNETGFMKWVNLATAADRYLYLDTWSSANPIRIGGSEVQLGYTKSGVSKPTTIYGTCDIQNDTDITGELSITGNCNNNNDFIIAEQRAAQSINDATETDATFTTTVSSRTITKTTNTIFTIAAGLYQVNVKISFATNGTGVRRAYILHTDKLASTKVYGFCRENNPTSSDPETLNFSALVRDTLGDGTIKIVVYQSSGGALNTAGAAENDYNQLSIFRVGDI